MKEKHFQLLNLSPPERTWGVKVIKRSKWAPLCLLFILALMLEGCSFNSDEKDTGIVSTEDMRLVYEETISPNKDYAQSEEEIVYYTVEIYQDKDDKIWVNADSNSAFLKKHNMKWRMINP